MVRSFSEQLFECVEKGNINKADFLLLLSYDINSVQEG